MKLTVESTDQIVEVDGVPCRIWTGVCDGTPVHALIHRIAVPESEDATMFDINLLHQPKPHVAVPLPAIPPIEAPAGIDLRSVL